MRSCATSPRTGRDAWPRPSSRQLSPPYKSDEHPEGGLDDATIGAFEDAVRKDRLAFLDQFCTNFFSAGNVLKVSEDQRVYARFLWH